MCRQNAEESPIQKIYLKVSGRKIIWLRNMNDIILHSRWPTYQLTLVLLNLCVSSCANSVDSDQLASEEANWSGFALFAIMYVNLYQISGSSSLNGWKLEVGVAS